MSSDDIAITVRNLTKTYRLFGHPGDRIKQLFSFGLKQYHREFTALNDVSFDIKKGETVGIIGRNGSGKSTLLQLICGILKPTLGSVSVNGRISALLELGAGFNPEFTGRENVYFQGALMGFTETQMDEKFDDIVSFADIGEFIDQPVRTYSSGMFVRLAFAGAVSVEPDILVVDEALAVGDSSFQVKCFRRMERLRSQGTSIVLVTHHVEQVARFCDRALLLVQGVLTQAGDVAEALTAYSYQALADSAASEFPDRMLYAAPANEIFHTRIGYCRGEHRLGNGAAYIVDYYLGTPGLSWPVNIRAYARLSVAIKVQFTKDIVHPIYGMTFKSKDGVTLHATNTIASEGHIRPQAAGSSVWVTFECTPNLGSGRYFISVAVAEFVSDKLVYLDSRNDAITIDIADTAMVAGIVNMQSRFFYRAPLDTNA